MSRVVNTTPAMSERTPLLHNPGDVTPSLSISLSTPSHSVPPSIHGHKSDDAYNRFTKFEKYRMLAITSYATILTFFAEGSFVPTIAVVAADLHTTQNNINITVAIYMIMVALGGLIWGVYSGYYGKRPSYLWCIPMYIIGSFGVAVSQNIRQLAIMRGFQGFGTSCFATVGVATISDIFRLEERGTALGLLFAGSFLGPAIAPSIGGAVSHFFSWRIMQVILGTGAIFALILVLLWLPETAHPGTTGWEIDCDENPMWAGRRRFVFLNPLKPLALLASPPFALTAIIQAVALSTDFFLLIPMSYIFSHFYGIKNEFIIGALFLPSGVGNILGAIITGSTSDWLVSRGKKKRGRWSPEDRLKAAWPGALIFAPGSVLAYALTCTYVPGSTGIGLCCLWLFMNGFSIPAVLGPCNIYGIDIFYSRSSHVVCAYNSIRHALAAVTSAIVLILIQNWGLVYAGLFFAGAVWVCCILLFIAIQYGEALREWKDFGYTMKEE